MKYNNIPVLYMLLFTNFIMISKLVLVIIDFCETAKLFGTQLTGRMIFDFLVTLAFVIIIIIIVIKTRIKINNILFLFLDFS